MIKPLLKVIPALSGNLKLACTLSNYQQIDDNTFKATSKSARIYPLSSNSFQSLIDVNLYTSSWEYDVCKYYKVYSDIFYKDTFTFDKNNLLYCNDLSLIINDRNSEFEFGCKRVSYEKTGKQLAFFAPIYCDSIDDLPDSFEIELNIHNEDIYNVTKKIIVDLTDTKNNYLYIYLKRYLSKIDDNVIFMQPKTKQATYYGIDVRAGGFNKYVDNIISKIFSEETTVNGFDALISGGFKRNGLIMKQIIPLAFYFSANDILNDFEQLKLNNASINIKGIYVKNNNSIPFYMIDDNYDNLSLKTLVLNSSTGNFEYKYNFSNILDIQDNTAVSVKNVEEYKYSNKLNKTYNRWMLKYSDINAPYITNNNYVFSKNQLLNNLYYEYPQNYYPTSLFCEMDNETNNINLILPIGDNITIGAPYYNYTDITNRYKLSLNNYINNWFDITNEKTLDYILEHTNWHDIHNNDNKIFYKGLLYDFNNIYKSFELEDTIDKFAILLYINDSKLYTNENISNYIYSSSVMINNNSNDELNLENNVYSNIYLSYDSSYNTVSLYDLNIVDENNEYKPNYLYDTNKYFTYNELGLGKYVDINSLGLNFYEINKYYAISEEYKDFDIDESEIIESFELLPIYYINNIIDLIINNKTYSGVDSLLNNIYYSSTNTVLKNKLSEFNDIKNADATIFENYIFYYKRLFISYNKYNYYIVEKQLNIDSIIYKENNDIVDFLYYPKYITDTNKEILNIFVRKDPHNCFYGNNVPFSYITADNDVLYIDPYNIKDVLVNTYHLDCSLYISNVYDTNDKQFTYVTLSNMTLNDDINSILYNNDDTYSDNSITVKTSYTNKAYVLDLFNYTTTYFNQDKYDYNKFNVDNIIKKINGLTYCNSSDDINYSTNIQFNIKGNIYKYNLINSAISNIVIEENLLDNILNINTAAYVRNIDLVNNKIYINTFTNQNTNNSYEFILQCSPDNIYKYGYLTGAMTYVIDRYIINSNRIGTYFNGDTSYSGIFGNYPQKIITAINNLHYDSTLTELFNTKYNIDLTDDIEFIIEQSSLNKEKIENPTTYITLNNNINISNINITKGDYLYNVSPYITNNEYYAKIKDIEALNIFKQYINQYAINDKNIVKNNKSSLTDTELLNYIYIKEYYINEQGNVYIIYKSLNKHFGDDIEITQNKDYVFNIKDNEYELYFKKMFIKLTKEIYDNIIALDDIHSKYNDLYIYRLEHNNDMESNVKYNFDNDSYILNNNNLTINYKTTYHTTNKITYFDTVSETNTYYITYFNTYNNEIKEDTYTSYSIYIRTTNKTYSYSNSTDLVYDATYNCYTNTCYFTNIYNYKRFINKYTTYNTYYNFCNVDMPSGTYYTTSFSFSSFTEGISNSHPKEDITDGDIITVTYNTVKTISESLVPLFNSIFKEDKYNTVIYKDRILDKINPVVFSNTEYTYTLYRSNNYDTLMLYDVTGIMTYTDDGKFANIQPGAYSFIYDTAKYTITYNSYSDILNDTTYTTTYLNDITVTYTYTASKIKTFDIFSNTTANIINITNNNELYNKYKLNVYKKGDTTYGFYLIEINISNLNNTFNLIEYYNGNTNYESIKYFTHINNINIINNHYNLSKLFKLIIPALNINILNSLYSIPILVTQHKSTFNKKYKNIVENNKKHIVLVNNDYKQSITLYRYFDNIIPYIVESNNIFTEYLLKVKTLQNISFTDDIMYNIPINIYNYPGIRIYNDETNYSVIKQLEYKYYNDNMFINLEDEFSIHISDLLTYDDLLKYQNNKLIIQYFTKYINNYKKIHFNDTEILFLFKKYNVLLLSYHNKLNYNFNEKLYSLTYKFKLK